MKRIYYILMTLLFLSCNKDFVETKTQVELLYDKNFTTKFGNISSSQEWGGWTLNAPAQTRSEYRDIVYPSPQVEDSIIKVLGGYYDGINIVNVPEGEYWVKTIYKNDYIQYTDIDFFVTWFYPTTKMSNVSTYKQNSKSYVTIEGLDSIGLVTIDEYDGVMPQFAYYDEIFSENHYEYLTVEHDGVYYVGFDFYIDGFIEINYKTNDGLRDIKDRNYIHDDWIIMLIPADKYGEDIVYDEKRVICEYMTTSPDFDFNDLVYDVGIVSHKDTLKTRITIQAIGCQHSMIIAGREVHKIMGVEYGTANTGGKEGQKRVDPAVFYLDEIYTDIRDIGVSMFTNNKLYFLTCGTGEPPKRICVNKDFKWCAGEIRIDFVYPDFTKWVRGEITDWENNYLPELVFKQ